MKALMDNEIKEILTFVNKSKAENYGWLMHADSPWRIKRYIQKADKIKKELVGGKILDWGCGYGQMSYLLSRRGFEVFPFDVGAQDKEVFASPLLEKIGLNVKISSERVKLPYPDDFFDGVLSCGTLEHVENIEGSLKEINRVLKQDGKFFMFMFPNKFSYIETIMKAMKKSCHDIRYSLKGMLALLEKINFSPYCRGYDQILPQNLSFFPEPARKLYDFLGFVLEPLDYILTRVPGINIFSTTIYVFSKKRQ